jgi:hypothetical protein
VNGAPRAAVLLLQDPGADARRIVQALEASIPGVTWDRASTAASLDAALERAEIQAVVYDDPVPGLEVLDVLAILARRPTEVPLVCS